MKERKKVLRKQIALWKKLYKGSPIQQEQGREVLDALEHHPAFVAAHTVLLYHSLPDEVDTHRFIDKWCQEKRLLLPVVIGDNLELRLYTGANDLSQGAFNIYEPIGQAFGNYDEIEFAAVPGVAFDLQGNRLGRGCGYYDKLLPRLTQAYKVGICYPFQILREIPTEPLDIKMDEIIITKQ